MRIGIDARICGIASGTGIGRYVEELLRAIAVESLPEDWEFVVFLRRDGYDAFTPLNQHWTKILADFRPYSIGAQMKFPKVIRAAGVDCMHFTHFDHPLWYRGPFLITIHDLILFDHPSIRASTLGPVRFWTKYHAYRTVIQHAAHQSIRILTPSHAVKDDIAKRLRVPPEKIIPTSLGVDHVLRLTDRQSEISNQRSPYLLYVGNAYPHKNLQQLIRIAPQLAVEHPNLRIVLVGKMDDFSRRIRERLPKRTPIVFSGPATEHELHTLIAHALAYVSVSRDEGFDLPCVEAQALGTPVISSDIPAHREILGDGAYFLPTNDDAALRTAIHRLTVDNTVRDILVASGTSNATQYSWTRCARATVHAYRETIATIDSSKGPP